MRLPTIILAFSLLLPVVQPVQAAPGARNVTREIPLGNSDIAAVEAMLNENRSPFGTFTILKVRRVVKITDTPENIEAARDLGVHVIHFSNPKQAVANLKELLGF